MMLSIEDKVAKYGRSLVINFQILVKLTGMYDSMNEAIVNAVNRLMADMEVFISGSGEFSLKVVEGSFYIEGIRVKPTVTDIDAFNYLARELKKKSIGNLDFRAPIRADDLVYLAYAIKGGAEASEVQSALESKLTKSITVGGPVAVQKEEGIDLRDAQAVAKRAYIKAVSAVAEIDNALKTGRRVQLKRIKRSLQLVVDSAMTSENYILGFTTFRNHSSYNYLHPANVAVLSTVLGKRIGLNRAHLRLLATAALLHDIGKSAIPVSILNKKTDYTPKEQELIKQHPIDGVKILLRLFGLNEFSIFSMLSSYEHHMNIDLSGYPKAEPGRNLNLLSRIISIADEFDSLVSGRVWQRKPLSTEEALKIMCSKSGTHYDPSLMKAFVEIFRG